MEYRRFVLAVLWFTAGFVVLAACFNFMIDPASLFHPDGERGAAVILSERGDIGVMGKDYDDRFLQKYRISLEKQRQIEWLVVGSSRAMLVSEPMLGPELINLSVSGASVEDLVALLHIGANRISPRNILIEIDPWLFNVNNGQVSWKSLAPEYSLALDELGLGRAGSASSAMASSGAVDKYLQLISLDYFKASMKRRLIEGASRPRFFRVPPFVELPAEYVVNRRDGSRVYERESYKRSLAEVRASALNDGRPPAYSLAGYQRISPDVLAILDAVIRKYQSNVKIALLLSPYHPITFKMIADRYPMVNEAEAVVRALAAKYNLKLVGSYDPAAAGCVETEFFDGLHPMDSCIRKIIQSLR